MARSTRLVILIKNIYTLWCRKRFLLHVTYFPTNLVYPFTLRVTGINILDERRLRKTVLLVRFWINVIKIDKLWRKPENGRSWSIKDSNRTKTKLKQVLKKVRLLKPFLYFREQISETLTEKKWLLNVEKYLHAHEDH